MRLFAIIFILILNLNCLAQSQPGKTKISKQTEQVVAKIEKINVVMGIAVYEEGMRPPQYDNFTELQKKATKAELIELTTHPNGVVRCYAFWALSYDTSANLLPLIITHINDKTLVKTQFGCLGGTEKVGDFFISVATPNYVDLNSKKLTPAEYEYLDSILLYTPTTLYEKENAIERAKLTEKFYVRARSLVLKENNQPALVALAKFRKEQDIPLILKNKLNKDRYNQSFFTYRAICEFPHTSFLPLLEKSVYNAINEAKWSTEWRELYKAIAAFKNDTALRLLRIPFSQVKYQDIREYHIDFIFEAVQKFYIPVYDNLLWEMWENEKKISPLVFKLLFSKDPEKAFQLIKKTIQNADDFYYLNTAYSESEDYTLNLLGVMLDTIIARDKPFAVELINKNIREIDVHQFPTFADQALKLKDTTFVTSLFARLEKEDNPHIYLKTTEILIAFNDNNINKRIIEVSKRNTALQKDWGGKAFIKLLKENNISDQF